MPTMVETALSLPTITKYAAISNGELALSIAALGNAGKGFSVFPCHETYRMIVTKNGKKRDWIKSPYGSHGADDLTPGLKRGFHDASRNPVVIHAWWERWPGALIGIALPADKLVLDLDVNHADGADGLTEFARLNELHGGTPVSCGIAQRTLKGGNHLMFALPALPPGYRIPDTLAPGIDIKGYGNGYICSGTLPDGNGYTWLSDEQTFTSALTLPPLWVIQIIAQANAPKLVTLREYAPTDKPDIERVKAALGKINKTHAEDYSLWIKVGLALHGLSSDGLALWHEFSRQSAKYDSEVLDKKWKTFKRDISIGYIFNLAKHS